MLYTEFVLDASKEFQTLSEEELRERYAVYYYQSINYCFFLFRNKLYVNWMFAVCLSVNLLGLKQHLDVRGELWTWKLYIVIICHIFIYKQAFF